MSGDACLKPCFEVVLKRVTLLPYRSTRSHAQMSENCEIAKPSLLLLD